MKTCYQRLAAIVAATVLIGFSAQMIGYAESDVVTIPRSKILTSEDSGVMESDISGRFYFTIEGDRAVTVSVTKYTAENGKNGDVYYTAKDTVLLPAEDGSSITYMMELDDCNRIDLSDPDNIGTVPDIYRSDYTNENYTSVFSISIADAKISEDVYLEDQINVGDTRYDPQTNYHYTISYVEDQDSHCVSEKKDAVYADSATEKNGTVTLDRTIQFYQPSYDLGDVDRSGAVDLTDATLVLTYYAEQSVSSGNLPDIVVEAADVDEDGSITITDATLVLTYYAECAVGYTGTIQDMIASMR